MKIKNIVVALIASVILSCTKDDIAVVPKIDSVGLETGILEIQLGETLVLSPKLNTLDVTYEWTVDGDVVSVDNEYTFEAKVLGDYAIHYVAKNSGGEVPYDYAIKVIGKYSNGLFIINEGWFGHEPGSINFWDRESDEILTTVFSKENNGNKLGTTTQFACINEGKLFLVSKDPDHLIVANSETLVEEGRVSIVESGVQARAFAYQDASTGYLSTTNGIIQVDLNAFTLGESVSGLSGEVGKMMVLNNKLFALKSKSLYVINTSSLEIEKTIVMDNATSGMLVDKDGLLWLSAGSQLVNVNTESLEVNRFDLPEGIAVNSGFVWDAGGITYSKQEHTLFFVNKGGWSARTVAKYDITTNTAEVFCKIDSDYMIYGAGTYVDPVSNKLYVTALKGWGDNARLNKFYVYDMNGEQEKVIDYDYFYFPGLCLAN